MARTQKVKAARLAAIKATAHKNLPISNSETTAIKVEDLLNQVEECLIACDYEESRRICYEVLKLDEFNSRALEALALVEIESGDVKLARKLLNQCVTHCKPTAPPTVHLYLAQLADTAESSLKHFEMALIILRGKLEQIEKVKPIIKVNEEESLEDNSEEKVEWSLEESQIRRSCSRALVGMTEIYLTDLCFDETAEEKCLEYLSMASSLDPTDPEPLQTLASVRISQNNLDAAREALQLSWNLWREKRSIEKENTTELNEMDEDVTNEPVLVEGEDNEEEVLPPLESRVQWAKLAIECDLWPAAIEALQQCEAEDDENGEVQYLLAVAWHMMGEDREKNPISAELPSYPKGATPIGYGLDKSECWLEAKECIDTCVQLQQRLGENAGLDESIIKHIEELDKQLQGSGIMSKPISEEVENNEAIEEDDGDENWESDIEMA
ncbi:hypothetical protein CROQUDRAFT_655092 [Cronartium quercuum f. sp. fusiforme G11]|uniref:Assembly chaperone of rpl4 n=1 Tax=Cronartium quercuum f. sp. fusiforme G11 TaxID=708437 RepID=A0A9P6NQ64_9BASI|nr:hypothetical protein CROQUDRAFT_655092 [Cronartium quercuum f. sp. fusiforme G11]